MLVRKEQLLLLLVVLLPAAFAQPSCRVSTEFPLTYPGASVQVSVSYSDFPIISPLGVMCRPNLLKLCIVGPGSGECQVTCEYPYMGVYTVTAASFVARCEPALVVADPAAKPTCTIVPDKNRGNGTLSTRLLARFSNLLPNITEVSISCGRGDPPFAVQLIGHQVQAVCNYRAETRKEVFYPWSAGGGANCSVPITVIPTSDSVPPQVSFYNLTYRAALGDVTNILINASDNVEVERVELHVNGVLASTMLTPPYSYVFRIANYSNGTEFVLQAKAYDIYGNHNVTDQYLVTKAVVGARACKLVAEPRYSPIPAAITLKATFYNTSSDVLYASFHPNWPHSTINRSGSQTQISNSTATGRVSYTTAGTYAPYVTDANISCNTTVYITSVPDKTPPTVYITGPKNNQQIMISDIIELRAYASDALPIQNIEYYIENRLIGNSSDLPFNTTWNTSNEHIGFYYVRAVAYDLAGNPSSVPSKALVEIYTNRTCTITPADAMVLPREQYNFTVSCFNYTITNVSQAITNITTTNGTQNFTIVHQETLETRQSKISCPPMLWSTSLVQSQIKTITGGISFVPQNIQGEVTGTITATDPISGLSCSADILLVNKIPGCSVSLESPLIVGARIPVTVSYENLTNAQEFTVTCRPNSMATCQGSAGSGSCAAYCDYPIVGRFSVTAASVRITCQPKTASVFPHPDVFPPVVSITRPFNRQILTGDQTVEAYATDNFGISSIEFYVDSELVGSVSSSPYTFDFNTTAFRNGEHSLTARAVDETGNDMNYTLKVTLAN